MIRDVAASHFIFIYHPGVFEGKPYTVYKGKPLTNGEMLEYWGKWIVLGDRPWLDKLARKLDLFVEHEKIPCVKYDREPAKNLAVDECVMMVYCDKRQRDEVWDILRKFGVKLKAWISEKESMEMWLPGGRLLEKSILERNLSEVEAEEEREDARKKIGRIFDYPDAVFEPWRQ